MSLLTKITLGIGAVILVIGSTLVTIAALIYILSQALDSILSNMRDKVNEVCEANYLVYFIKSNFQDKVNKVANSDK